MIRHIVAVTADGEAAVAQLETAFQRIGRIVQRLDGALSFAYGPSNSPEGLERGYTHALVIDFRDPQALHEYAVDPEHVTAGKLIAEAAVGGVDGLLVLDLELVTADATNASSPG